MNTNYRWKIKAFLTLGVRLSLRTSIRNKENDTLTCYSDYINLYGNSKSKLRNTIVLFSPSESVWIFHEYEASNQRVEKFYSPATIISFRASLARSNRLFFRATNARYTTGDADSPGKRNVLGALSLFEEGSFQGEAVLILEKLPLPLQVIALISGQRVEEERSSSLSLSLLRVNKKKFVIRKEGEFSGRTTRLNF